MPDTKWLPDAQRTGDRAAGAQQSNPKGKN
jgi:hypothetical protein